jgi:general secretion pathway protein G
MSTKRCNGFTLIELVITVAVLAILTLGVIPLVQVSVKRQKEEQLRAALREMREAIDQFHREANAGGQQQPQPGQPQPQPQPNQQAQPNLPNQPGNPFADPRVRVFITDQTIFSADNPDRYPPDLETLVKGVSVLPLTIGGLGRRGNLNYSATEAATEDSAVPKTKIYLRKIPIDPMTGTDDWCVSSAYQPADEATTSCSKSGDTENVFNVHSRSDAKALDGSKYSEW